MSNHRCCLLLCNSEDQVLLAVSKKKKKEKKKENVTKLKKIELSDQNDSKKKRTGEVQTTLPHVQSLLLVSMPLLLIHESTQEGSGVIWHLFSGR